MNRLLYFEENRGLFFAQIKSISIDCSEKMYYNKIICGNILCCTIKPLKKG